MNETPKRIEIPEQARRAMIDLYNRVLIADRAFGMYMQTCKEQLGLPLDKPYTISEDGLAFELVEEQGAQTEAPPSTN